MAITQPALAQGAAGDTSGLPPAGFGTLHQDDVAVRMAAANVQLRVMPLDERIIRLLAPDTYRSMSQLVASRSADIEQAAIQHGVRPYDLFLVTFFGLQPRVEFNPEGITLTSQNRLFRPVALLPLSAQWSQRELNQRETASAIYLFEEGIALLEPIIVSYDGVSSTQWEQALRSIEQERARVFARAAAAPKSP
ncbi:MAG: hypothetical protein HY700_13940 [Gemmatimonadetes bacterium]|nr:hypothetical protein [Gemmatimonadota bacterium]